MIAELLGIAGSILGTVFLGGAGFAVGKKIEKNKTGKEFDEFLKNTKDNSLKIVKDSNMKSLK